MIPAAQMQGADSLAQFKRSNKGGTNGGSLQYPETMNGDRIMFEVVDYQKSGLGNLLDKHLDLEVHLQEQSKT